MSSMSSFRSFASSNTKYNNIMPSRRKCVYFPIYYHLYKSRRVPTPFSNQNLRFSIYSDDLEFSLLWVRSESAWFYCDLITVYLFQNCYVQLPFRCTRQSIGCNGNGNVMQANAILWIVVWWKYIEIVIVPVSLPNYRIR